MLKTSSDATLNECLDTFRDSVNGHPRLQKLLVGWKPNILIEAVDTGEIFTLVVDGAEIHEVEKRALESDWLMRVEAEDEVLRDVFSGRRNPGEAYLDGDLAVFGSDKDQVKLDAITLVIWGM